MQKSCLNLWVFFDGSRNACDSGKIRGGGSMRMADEEQNGGRGYWRGY